MRHRIKPKIWIFTILLIPFVIISCDPDKEDYTDIWLGNWQTYDETTFPQNKYLHQGTIIRDKKADNTLQISGTLFGLNSSYIIKGKTTNETNCNIEYEGNFTIKGKAIAFAEDSIRFYLLITQDNKTIKDTITASKIK